MAGGGMPLHRRSILTPLGPPFLLAPVAAAAGADTASAPAGAASLVFHVVIEGRSPRVTAAPSSLSLTTGWRQRCVLELENRDGESREVSFTAEPPFSMVAPDSM